MSIKGPIQMLQHWEETFPEQVFLRQSTGSDWIEYDWASVADTVRRIANYIDGQNYPAGSNIAIWSSNSADWILVDLAIMLSGHVSVPVYPAQDLETAEFILQHSEPELLFVGSFEQAQGFQSILPDGLTTVAIRGATVDCDTDLQTIIDSTEPKADFPPRDLEDVSTIIYSSGTSSLPKGVMLTFKALAESAPLIAETYQRQTYNADGGDRERLISYLPLSHAAERSLVEISGLYLNSCISFSAGLQHFSEEMKNVRPTFFGAVPRIWYKLKEGAEAGLAAMGRSIGSDEDRMAVREMLGLDKVRMCITGSAPTAPDVQRWYADMGLILRDSYGLTESFAFGALWTREEPAAAGCVGTPAKGVSLKLDDSNQILVKSPSLLKGYFKDEVKTKKALLDGWFATGDLGRVDENGDLWITGRVGSIFKSSKGKFINPERLEKELHEIEAVEQALVFGQGLAQPVAVVSLAEAFQQKGDKELQTCFEAALATLNDALPSHERIQALLVSRDVWTTEGGEMTPTLKLKRNVVQKKYEDVLVEDVSGVMVASTA